MADIRLRFYPLTIINRISETEDAASFVLEVPDNLNETFAYQAGQFLTFQIPWGNFAIQRCYSLSSSPLLDRKLKFTVKRVTDGRVSNWFNDGIEAGTQVMVAPPSGRFQLRNQNDNPLILFAGGSGITPIVSLIKTTLAVSRRPIQLIYANQNAKSVIFGPEIDKLRKKNPDQFACRYHYDDCGRFLEPGSIESAVAERWHADFYICGPAPFMDLIEAVLATHPVSDEQIHIERFVSSIDPDRAIPDTADNNEIEPSGAAVEFKVTVDGKDFAVGYLQGKSLLESILVDQNVDAAIPHSCQQGHCGSCMAMLKTGEVAMHSNRVLSRRDLARGYVLACQSIPVSSEVWIDFDV